MTGFNGSSCLISVVDGEPLRFLPAVFFRIMTFRTKKQMLLHDGRTLIVCWELPGEIDPDKAVVLSFLSPTREETLRRAFHGEIISAREWAPRVKERARKIYVRIVSRIAATPIPEGGRTLRQSLTTREGICLWWFHKVSEKDCESDPTFRLIVEILTIHSVLDASRCREVVFRGGLKETAGILRERCPVRTVGVKEGYGIGYMVLRPLLSRLKFLVSFLRKWFVLGRVLKQRYQGTFDAVFSGFWDWSVKINPKSKDLEDRYFKSLPDRLIQGGAKVGRLVWLAPETEPGSEGRRLREILRPVLEDDRVVILQTFLHPWDLLKAVLNFKPFLKFASFLGKEEFRSLFRVEGLDLFPLLKPPLVHGFLNSGIPHLELVYTSGKRAFKQYKPAVSVSFLELFLHSRALYSGARQGSPGTVLYAVQHASYSREKTFVLLDPETEYRGEPDGCPIPKPDYIFAMGELGREIFMESGFPPGRVLLTGSSRYEHIRESPPSCSMAVRNPINLLIVPALDRELEMEMVEAVYCATRGMPEVQLHLRSHPFARMEEYPPFLPYRDRIRISDKKLEEDLGRADLVVFSYSTVAEEALIKGIPAWQWVSASYNGSVFRDLRIIPSFNEVSDLRSALKEFLCDPKRFSPSDETKSTVIRKCFFRADGRSSERISDHLLASLSS